MKNLFLLVGPSGSGKSTLEANLVKTAPEQFHKAISATTREKRKGEVDGVDYYFKQREGENRGLPVFDPSEMLETVEFAGNLYGLPVSEVSETKDTIVVVEPNGVVQITEYVEENMPDTKVYVIYMDIPFQVRLDNMIKERGDDPKTVRERLAKDNIEETFKAFGIKADLTIKKLNPQLHFHVLEWIEVTKRIYSV